MSHVHYIAGFPVTQDALDDAEYIRALINAPPLSPEERAKRDAERDAEMAACPYVACTCGWHEE